ncbi:uncharacterized protein Ecym_3228 [Eremothecium cymbalariae DBVPG|uniref:Uncharacterized protein n=1 Tax=Eremothecium cymbalariae (strain CBS 270.75 / DBVPG 7215 / KCTC 17166 / NRRL Y-17582) TaxID=931890 RepID=G8JRF5_ERECY|nr:Hypothetical protein Ecym_3228 [Eremothecium cymbalariae DBVPG\
MAVAKAVDFALLDVGLAGSWALMQHSCDMHYLTHESTDQSFCLLGKIMAPTYSVVFLILGLTSPEMVTLAPSISFQQHSNALCNHLAETDCKLSCDLSPKSSRDGTAFKPNCEETPPGTGPERHGNEELLVSVTHARDNHDEAVRSYFTQFDDERKQNLGYAIADSRAAKMCVNWHNVDISWDEHNVFRGEACSDQYGGLDNQCYISNQLLN